MIPKGTIPPPFRLFTSSPFCPKLFSAPLPSEIYLDGLIVLGASLNPQGRPGRVARLRLVHGLTLWRDHFPQACLIFTGGCSGGAACSEARAMADWSRAWIGEHWGQEVLEVLADRVLLEETALNTAASARRTLLLAQASNLQAVGLVSDSLHIHRAHFLFRRQFHPWGISVYPLPAPGLLRHYWARRRYRHLGKMAVRETGAWLKALAWELARRSK